MLIEAVSVIVDTDILHKYQWDLFYISHYLASSLTPASLWFCIWSPILWRIAFRYCSCYVCRLRELEETGYFSVHGQTLASDHVVQEYKSSTLLLPVGTNYEVSFTLQNSPLNCTLAWFFPFPVMFPHSFTSFPRKYFFNESLAHKFLSQGLFMGMSTWACE